MVQKTKEFISRNWQNFPIAIFLKSKNSKNSKFISTFY